MLIFLEDYIQKKIRVAEYIYLYGKDFSREEATKTIRLSAATLNQYVSEIYENFKAEYQGGILLNSQSMEKVCSRLFSESKKLETLRLLMEKPGKSANFYTDQLMISSASFSRVIANLKEDLAYYNIQIFVRNGYRLEAENMHHVTTLSTFLSFYYKWPTERLSQELTELIGEEFTREVTTLSPDKFPKLMNELPYMYYQVFLIKSLIRKYQQLDSDRVVTKSQVKKDYEAILEYLWYLADEAKIRVQSAFPKIVSRCFPNGICIEKKHELERFLIQIMCDYISFPYGITTIPMRMVFFNHKHRFNYPNLKPSVDTFVYRVSEILRIDLMQRYEVVFYNLSTKNLLGFSKRSRVHLLVYSSIGKDRNEYMKEQLFPLIGYFSSDSTIDTFKSTKEQVLDEYTLIITTDILPEFPTDRQFLISDFVSLTDFLAIMTWILEKVGDTTIRIN